MPRLSVSWYMMTLAVATTSQLVSQSILHHIDMVAISNMPHGRGVSKCSPFVTDSVAGATIYNASALKYACDRHMSALCPTTASGAGERRCDGIDNEFNGVFLL